MKDPQGRPTVVDLLRGIRGRVFPVGRLDFDTEGLLLFTNDGALARELMHPSRRVPKIYAAKVTGKLTDEEIAKLEAGGMVLETGRTAPCRVRRVRESGQSSWVEVTLHEGKKRQVRLMLERLGHPVSKLIRTQYAGLVLGELSLGKSRLLTAAEVRRLQVAAQGRPAEPPASGPAPTRRPRARTATPATGRRVREKAVRR
jgi:pseudouridine synthase